VADGGEEGVLGLIRYLRCLPRRVLTLRGEDALGRLGANDEHAADAARLVDDRRESVGPVHILELAVAEHRDESVFVPEGLSAAHHVVDLRTDDGPYLRPGVSTSRAHRDRVFPEAEARYVGVVVELGELGAPPEKHRMPRAQQDTYRRAQADWPGLDWPDRRLRPVDRAHELTSDSTAGEERTGCGGLHGSFDS
jgi:hypothetical protein